MTTEQMKSARRGIYMTYQDMRWFVHGSGRYQRRWVGRLDTVFRRPKTARRAHGKARLPESVYR